MLVLHPTSRCDICLDDYTWVTPKHSPYAIACGHIFCLICLEQLEPSTCPLCRKHFQADRVKKLHVDKAPDESDGSNRLLDSHSNVLLQRIAMVSGDRAPDADVAEVITEVFQWLENESDALNANQPLKYAVKALQRHKALAEKYSRKKDELAALETRCTNLQRDAEHDLETSRAVEEGLLAQLEEVDMKWANKLQTAENQLAELRNEMSRFKGGSNPLPPPPQPLPFDRLPGFARHIIDPGAVPPFPNANGVLHPYLPTSQHQMNTNGNGRHVAYPHPLPVIDGGSTQQQPKSRKTRRADSTGTHNHENAPVATNGSAHTQAIFIPNRNSASPDQTELSRNTEKKNKRSVSFNEAAQTSNRGYRANNGNGSGIPSRSRHSSGGTPGPSSSRTKPKTSSSSQNKYTYVEPGTVQQPIPIPSTGASTSNRAKIIPGAHPEERIIPPREPLPPKFMREEPTAQSSVDWARRQQEGSSSHHYHRRRDHDERRRSYQGVSISRHVRGGVMSDGETDEVENRLNSASAFVAGYGSGYEEGLGYASASAYRPYIPPPPHPERAMFGHGVVASTTSMQSVSVSASVDSEEVMTPRARPAETHRDSEPLTSTTTATWGSSSSDLLGRVPPASSQPPPPPAVVGLQQLDQILSNDNRPRTHDLPVVDDTPGRQSLNSLHSSVSSWGTVPTPSASARGSFSDLNLIGLPQAQAIVRGDTETSTPVLGEEDGTTSRLLGTYPIPRATQTSSSMGFTVEPRAGVVHTQGYLSEDERPRHYRSVSHPHVGTTTAGTTTSGQNTNGTPSSQIGRDRSQQQQQQQHRRRHTVTQSVSLDSGSLPLMGLGLTFDPSSSTATTATVDAQQQGGAAVQEGIRAPAPRMGGPNVITLWRP